MPSLQGHLLIAAPTLLDPNFARTVVLLVEHNDEGALGLVLNRALDMSVADAWKQVSAEPCVVEQNLYRGGPCEGPLMVVHGREEMAQVKVLSGEPGLYFAAEEDKVRALVEENASPAKYFVGYSGWGPGQLETELAAGGWMVAQADLSTIFDTPADLWQELVKSISRAADAANHNPSIVPRDPNLN